MTKSLVRVKGKVRVFSLSHLHAQRTASQFFQQNATGILLSTFKENVHMFDALDFLAQAHVTKP